LDPGSRCDWELCGLLLSSYLAALFGLSLASATRVVPLAPAPNAAVVSTMSEPPRSFFGRIATTATQASIFVSRAVQSGSEVLGDAALRRQALAKASAGVQGGLQGLDQAARSLVQGMGGGLGAGRRGVAVRPLTPPHSRTPSHTPAYPCCRCKRA